MRPIFLPIAYLPVTRKGGKVAAFISDLVTKEPEWSLTNESEMIQESPRVRVHKQDP